MPMHSRMSGMHAVRICSRGRDARVFVFMKVGGGGKGADKLQ